MKCYLFGLSFISTLVFNQAAEASLRVDLEDRSPKEVVQRSLLLAEQHPFAQATVAIWVNEKALATGIALDPYTVLTAAHIELLLEAENIFVVSSSNAQSYPKDCLYRELASPKVIVHEKFVPNPYKDKVQQRVLRDDTTGALEMHGKPMSELEKSSLQDFMAPELRVFLK